jgi:hypothetical protein
MASVMGGSFASPSADAQKAFSTFQHGILSRFVEGITSLNGWQIVLSIILVLVAYDQGIS